MKVSCQSRFHTEVQNDDFKGMSHNHRIEILEPDSHPPPNQSIPYGNPVEVTKRGYHKRIEGEH